MSGIEVSVADLQNALSFVVPRKRKGAKKPFVLRMELAEPKKLMLIGAKLETKGEAITFAGSWRGSVEIDGDILKNLVSKYPAEENIEIQTDGTHVSVFYKSSAIKIARLDPHNRGKTVKKQAKRHPRPEQKPDPTDKRVEYNDTWAFSARVPMPDPNKKS